ncbi:hypothetical protein BGZ99_006863 [Dissophora globulifera]|uniref:Cyclin n=1 Tax=Dissophora globulifera TaxID=979702 RepID=A0A9P6RDA2_9FUNG|nr:hypothetical protein BGZ99_006863 [Dissophora globulifera]
MRLEDHVWSLEAEFSLCLDDYADGEDDSEDSLAYDSEDSLAYLVPGNSFRGNSKDDVVVSTPHPVTLSRSSSQSYTESPSPDSTVFDLAESGEDQAGHLPTEDPPHYALHSQDQKLEQETMNPVPVKTELMVGEEQKKQLEVSERPATDDTVPGTRPFLTLQTAGLTLTGIAPGVLSAFESRPVASQFSMTKCNSTSSLYIDSTMAKSDVDETLRAVATVLYDKVLYSHSANDCRTERIINSSSYVPAKKVTMTLGDIFDFMRFIFDCGQNLGAENAVIALIYVERMTELGNLSFHAINWRRLLLGAIILSIKVWEDLAVFNSDVCAIFEGLSVKDVNALERFSMAKLQYNVSVKRSIYATYYFRLRDVSEQHYNERYGKLTLSMSKHDMLGNGAGTAGCGQRMANDSYKNSAGTGMSSSSNESLPVTHYSKVPIGPGYRKWTLKPLSVREADRLEARSSLFSSNMFMEEQERRDAGCYLDEYSSATPEELHNLSATLLTSSMHTIPSMASVSTTSSLSLSKTTEGDVKKTPASVATSLTSTEDSGSCTEVAGSENGEEQASNTMPTTKTLRLKKSRSDFFFQNSTPAAIM